MKTNHVQPCAVCGKQTACKVQSTWFNWKEKPKYVSTIFENCCPECKEEYLKNISKYCSLKVLLHHLRVTRKEWELQGCE